MWIFILIHTTSYPGAACTSKFEMSTLCTTVNVPPRFGPAPKASLARASPPPTTITKHSASMLLRFMLAPPQCPARPVPAGTCSLPGSENCSHSRWSYSRGWYASAPPDGRGLDSGEELGTHQEAAWSREGGRDLKALRRSADGLHVVGVLRSRASTAGNSPSIVDPRHTTAVAVRRYSIGV